MSNKILSKHFKKDLYKAGADFISSFAYWRIFCLIGINEIQKRYTRSKLGQFWLTLSLAIHIATLGVVWALLFKISVAEYLPYLAVGIIFWTFISTSITDGSNLYILSACYLKEMSIPKLSYVNSLFIKNIIILLHNVLVLIPVFIFCAKPVSLYSLLISIAGFILTILCLFASIIMVSLVSLRFRDLPNIILSLLQIAFYVTPVMWKIELMPLSIQKYLIFNPFSVFLSICRDPLLGAQVPGNYFLAAGIYTIIAYLFAIPLFSKFRTRIVYWL
jgi:ABC-type polysaccharide/polyol phosphate export permease